METKVLFEDDFISLTQGDKYLVCKIKNYVKKFSSLNESFFFSNMVEFESFKNRFEGVYEILKGKTNEAWHMVCKHIQLLEGSSCSIDVRFKLKNEEVAELLFSRYKKDKEDAIKELNQLISLENKTLKVEAKIDEVAKAFNLEETYKDHIGSPEYNKRSNALKNSMDDLLAQLKEINKNK